jgi:hypothetical protein
VQPRRSARDLALLRDDHEVAKLTASKRHYVPSQRFSARSKTCEQHLLSARLHVQRTVSSRSPRHHSNY